MRLQIILPTDSGSDTTEARSYVAARYLLKNDMPIAFIANPVADGSEDACPELEDIGLLDTDDPEWAVVDVARPDLPERGEEAQFLICGRTRSPEDVFLALAEWYNHLATGRTTHGAFCVVYVVPRDQVALALGYLETFQRVPSVSVNQVEVSCADGMVIGQPSRGPRFLVERSRLPATLEHILTDLADMDQAYDRDVSWA